MKPLTYPVPPMAKVRALADLAVDGADHRGWYDFARDDIYRAAALMGGIPPQRIASLLALFSPRVSVLRSVKWTVHYLTTNRSFAYDCTRHHVSAVTHWEQTGIIRGPKTEPFARALLGDKDALVLDGWMAVALSTRDDAKQLGKRFEVRAVHSAASKRITDTAHYLGWPIAETQAAIWAGVVRIHRATVPQLSVTAVLKETIPV